MVGARAAARRAVGRLLSEMMLHRLGRMVAMEMKGS